MSNTNTLESLTSVCITPQELIKSADFIKWVEIILERVQTFDKEYILSLFEKLQSNEVLNGEEKEEIELFVSDEIVWNLWQELLSKLHNISVNVKVNNTTELVLFSELLNSIFAKDWYRKIQWYVWEIAGITKLTLNTYEWMDKLTLTLPNWKERKIYIQRNFLKLSDDSILKYTLSNWALSNFPENKIKNNPLLITKNKFWDYHFGHTATEKLAEQIWMRLATNEEINSIEFNDYIVKNTTEFLGYRLINGSDFCFREVNSIFWGISTNWAKASDVEFRIGRSKAICSMDDKAYGFPVRLVKD